MELGFRYVLVPGEFYKREYLVPPGFEKRSRDLTSSLEKSYIWKTIPSLNGVPMMGKRGIGAYPPYNIDIRYKK
jgi:hypothetical protein